MVPNHPDHETVSTSGSVAMQVSPLAPYHWENDRKPQSNTIRTRLKYLGSESSARSPLTSMPDPRVWVPFIAVALIEIEAGKRPYAQLQRWLSATLWRSYRKLIKSGKLPTRTACRVTPGTTRIWRVGEGPCGFAALEATITVKHNQRIRPIAMRLEPWGQKWIITALEIGR